MEKAEDYANAFRQRLQEINSEGYQVAAQQQAAQAQPQPKPADNGEQPQPKVEAESPKPKTKNDAVDAIAERGIAIETDWNDKIDDYIAEHYPHIDGTRARTPEEQKLYDAEREALKNDKVYQEMVAARDAAIEKNDAELSEAMSKEERHTYTLSEKKAGNGENFYQDESGNIDLVKIPDNIFDAIGYTKAPFRLTPSMIKHMIGRHREELGFEDANSAIDFVRNVMINFDHIRLGYNGALVFSIENERRIGKRAVTVLINSDNGEFYGLKTSGYEGVKGLERRPLLWERGANETSSTDAASASVPTGKSPISGEQSGSASHQGNNLHDKDSESSAHGKDKKQTLTFADGTPMEMDKKGNVVYENTSVENTVNDLFGRLQLENDEVNGIVAAKRKAAEDTIKKLEKKKPKPSADINKFVKDKQTWLENMDAAKKSAEYWEKVAQEIERITTPEDAKNWQKELSGDASHEAYEQEKGDGSELPTAEDFAAQFISGAKISSDSFKKETGYGSEEMRKFVGMISKDGKSIERLAEELAELDNEEYGGQLYHGDSNEARNAIISALMSSKSKGDLKNRMSDNEKEFTEQREKDRDEAYMEKYHMTYEEYVKASEQEIPEMLRRAADSDAAFEDMMNTIRLQIKTPAQKRAAENAYKYAAENRPDERHNWAIVNMDNPYMPPRYFEKRAAAKWLKDNFETYGMGNFKIFNLDKTFEDNVKSLTGKFPEEFDTTPEAEKRAAEAQHRETVLRDTVVDILKKNGMDVSMNVGKGQRVLDEANKKEVRMNAKKRRALETASLGASPRSLTVVSSANGAKVLKNVETLASELDKSSTQPKTFIGDVAKALGASRYGSGSEYATFETKNGDIVTIRLANHNAHVSGFDYNGRDNGISIVISPKPNEGITNDGNAHIVEFYYDSIKLRRAEGKPLAEIVRSIEQALYSGEFKDPTGLAEVQEVNADDIARLQKVYHGSGADFEEFDHSHMGEGLQIHGAGTYVSVAKGKAEGYARKLAEDGSSNLYTVEIPDRKDGNYIEEEQTYKANDELRTKVDAALAERGMEPLGNEDMTGRKLYREVKNRLKSKKAASEFFEKLGLKGVHYFGRQDGECYVVFNDKDLKITDHVRFFKTSDGEAYGFTVGGKIYIDPRIANSETPIHEYAHLWASALKRGNAAEWKNVVELMKGTRVWDDVVKNYPELKTEDAIADEVIATYSGRRGAEKLRKMAEEVPSGKAFEKTQAIGAVEKIKAALDRFWKGVADMLHIHYTSAEEVADRVMKDLLDGVDPRKMGKDNVDKTDKAADITPEAAEEAMSAKLQKVTDKDELKKLDKEKTFRMYSGMQERDGKLYSPMAAIIDGKRTDATEIGAWMKADERPDLVKNGKFDLVKTDGKQGAGEGTVAAAYNPYMHTSTSMMNDQFTGAYARGNIKVVEWEIPESEKTSGYRAEGAKDAVGLVPWHSGSVNGLLPKDRQRSVMLSRWRKAVRVVPDSEVAEGIAKQLEGTDLAIPWNVVTPNQLKELAKLGVRITTEETGKQSPETKEAFLKQKAELEKEYPQAKFVDVKMTKDAYKEWGNGSVKKTAKKKPSANPVEGMKKAADAWREESEEKSYKQKVNDFATVVRMYNADEYGLPDYAEDAVKEAKEKIEADLRKACGDDPEKFFGMMSDKEYERVLEVTSASNFGLDVPKEDIVREDFTDEREELYDDALYNLPSAMLEDRENIEKYIPKEVIDAMIPKNPKIVKMSYLPQWSNEKLQAITGLSREEVLDKYGKDHSPQMLTDEEFEAMRKQKAETDSEEQGLRLQKNDVKYRIGLGETFSNDKKHFDAVRDRAIKEKGIVLPNLNKESVKVVKVENEPFGNNVEEALSNARQWAKDNLATTKDSELPTMKDGTPYTISNGAIAKYLSQSAVKKSDNLEVHLSALRKLPEIIHESIEAEIHADRPKDANYNRTSDNGYGKNILVHRLYGAVELDGKMYRVKTTMHEFRGTEENKPHSYEVTKIELLEGSEKANESDSLPLSSATNNSISVAKLLKGVEKTEEKGKLGSPDKPRGKNL